MNTLRTFMLFVVVMGAIILSQVATQGKKNSVITNSESLNIDQEKGKFVFSKSNYIYPKSRILQEDLRTIVMTTNDSREDVVLWYRNKFIERFSMEYHLINDREIKFTDSKGSKFKVSIFSKENSTIIYVNI